MPWLDINCVYRIVATNRPLVSGQKNTNLYLTYNFKTAGSTINALPLVPEASLGGATSGTTGGTGGGTGGTTSGTTTAGQQLWLFRQAVGTTDPNSFTIHNLSIGMDFCLERSGTDEQVVKVNNYEKKGKPAQIWYADTTTGGLIRGSSILPGERPPVDEDGVSLRGAGGFTLKLDIATTGNLAVVSKAGRGTGSTKTVPPSEGTLWDIQFVRAAIWTKEVPS